MNSELIAKLIVFLWAYICFAGLASAGCMVFEIEDLDIVAVITTFWPIAIVVIIVLKIGSYVRSLVRGLSKVFKEVTNVR